MMGDSAIGKSIFPTFNVNVPMPSGTAVPPQDPNYQSTIGSEPTVEEHLRFGRAVKDFDLALRQMVTGTAAGLGTWRFRKTSPEARTFRRAEKALQELRNVMDNKVCGLIGYRQTYGKDTTRFYYGEDDPRP